MSDTPQPKHKTISIETLTTMLGMKEMHTKDLMDSVNDSMKTIEACATNSEPVKTSIKDNYGNSLTASGTDDKVKSFTNYGFSNDTLNWWLWIALYNDSWVFRRAIDKPSQDMVRAGVNLVCQDDKVNEVYTELKKHRKQLINLIQWGRLFGGSVAVMMFDNMNDNDYSKPLDTKKLKNTKVMKLYVTDRWYGCAPSSTNVDKMSSIDYGKPNSYRITFANGHEINVHHTFVLRFEGRTAPNLIKNGHLQGWGYAEGSHILNELSRDDQLKASITSLVNKSLIEVIKMSGMRGVFMGADNENETQLRKRLEMVNWARNYNSLTFLDKDDEYQEHGFGGLGGLSDLLEKNMWLISAALEMQGVLYGDLKSGFSNDTEALERYDETINSLCENYFRDCMEKLLRVIYSWKGINEKVEFTFNSLLASKQDKDRIEGLKHYQELLSSLLEDGVITLKQYATALRSYSKDGLVDFDLDDSYIESLDDKMEEEMEEVDIEEHDNEEDFSNISTR